MTSLRRGRRSLAGVLVSSALAVGCGSPRVRPDQPLPPCADLDRLLVQELGRLVGVESGDGATRVQVVPGGLGLDPAEYRNAESLSNPGGSHRAAQAFSKLVDWVPRDDGGPFAFGEVHVEDMYGLIVRNARATGSDEERRVTATAIGSARSVYDLTAIPSYEPGCASCPPWRFTSATPANWAEPDGPAVLFALRMESRALGERLHCAPAQQFDVRMSVYVVHVDRPWMKAAVFGMPGWTVGSEGGKPVVVSSGPTEDGRVTGLLPMYPVAFVVARDVSVTVASPTGEGEAQVGSLVFRGARDPQTGAVRVAGLHVIAFVHRIVPRCPMEKVAAAAP